MKLTRAPITKTESKSPMIKSSNGEKFAICVLALAVKFVTKSVGNSIIVTKSDGNLSVL